MKILERFLSKHQDRIIGLDILRSIAILLVVYEHGIFLLPPKNQLFFEKLNFFKLDGVSIFFVLSGFLIGGILLRLVTETDFTKKDLLHFWIRRWFRTVPNYLIVLTGILAYQLYKFKDLGEFNFKYLLFLQNFSFPHPGFFPEAWSLSIEEWFYLLFPLSCYVFYKILKNETRSILIAALLFFLVPLFIRIVKFECGIGIDDFDSEFRKIVVLRLDSIMYGVIAAYLAFKQPQFWVKYKYFFFGTGILLLFLLYFNPLDWKNSYPPLYFNIESLTAFCFLPFLSSYKSTKLKVLDVFFIFISIISYSMYLLNLTPVQWHLIPMMNNFILGRKNMPIEHNYLVNYIAYWSITIIGSYLLYSIYEKPITELRDKITLK